MSFDIDADGIMNIEAVDKSSGTNEITIKNDKGRPSDDIDRMINEAERYKEDDKRNRETVEARNKLESLVYQTKMTLENKEICQKLESDDLETAQDF